MGRKSRTFTFMSFVGLNEAELIGRSFKERMRRKDDFITISLKGCSLLHDVIE